MLLFIAWVPAASSLLSQVGGGVGGGGGRFLSRHFAGYSAAGLPLYTTHPSLSTSSSTSAPGDDSATGLGFTYHAVAILQQVTSDRASFRIFVFLCLNLVSPAFSSSSNDGLTDVVSWCSLLVSVVLHLCGVVLRCVDQQPRSHLGRLPYALRLRSSRHGTLRLCNWSLETHSDLLLRVSTHPPSRCNHNLPHLYAAHRVVQLPSLLFVILTNSAFYCPSTNSQPSSR